jgi:opacity protein-like surface antigen
MTNKALIPLLTALALPAMAASTATPGSSPSLPEITAQAGNATSSEGGIYGNPEWTKHRRFATSRVFIQKDPWEVGVEQWWRGRAYDDGTSKHRFSEEIEIGLPFRMQFDFYFDWVHEGGSTDILDYAVELRYALADWNVIPMNPTLYAEYKFTEADMGPDVLELKLLLGGDLGEKWQYALNFVWEQELAGERTTEWQGIAGISRALSDSVGIGAEFKYVNETTSSSRSDAEHKVLLGPSIQWRPTKNTHLDVVSLFGLTKDAPDVEGWVVFGIDFDFGAPSVKKVKRPVSGARD